MRYIGVITHLLTTDPNFQRDTLVGTEADEESLNLNASWIWICSFLVDFFLHPVQGDVWYTLEISLIEPENGWLEDLEDYFPWKSSRP